MGWLSVQYRKARHETFTSRQAFEFLKDANEHYEFSMFHFVKAKNKHEHHECYVVMRHRIVMKAFICCTIIDIKDGEIYWKDIEESMSPTYDNCPFGFFNFIKAPNEIAEDWRTECRKKKIAFKPISEFYKS